MDYKERYEIHTPQKDDARSVYDADYAKIVHSASFRRLQGKTQILNLGDSDFYRTRLTHSLEVSQVAASIMRQLEEKYENHPVAQIFPEQSLLQAIGLAHDLGHPPFGHGGEVALNYCMRNNKNKGFEGNGHTLRILTKLEKFSSSAGANLSRRTLLGTLKYPVSYSTAENASKAPKLLKGLDTLKLIDREESKPPKCYLDTEKDIVSWLLRDVSDNDRKKFTSVKEEDGKHKKPLHKSLDCSIMDTADDIAYGVHDLEDAIALKLISEEMFREDVPDEKCPKFLDLLKERYKNEFGNNVYDEFVKKLFSDSSTRKRQIGRLVHNFITQVEIYEEDFDEPLLKYRARIHADHKNFLKALKDCVTKRVIKSANVQHLEFKGQRMVVSVFEVFCSEPKSFLPSDTLRFFEESKNDNRVICDYIAGMTDSFLLKTYDRLFSPRMGSVFDKL